MTNYRPVLSEDPDKLFDAINWVNDELKRHEIEKADSREIYESIKPLREEAFRKIREKRATTVVSNSL